LPPPNLRRNPVVRQATGFCFVRLSHRKKGFSVSAKSFAVGVATALVATVIYDKFIKPNMA